MTTIYGIKNCDTVKKARHWLDEHAVEYDFHDFRVDGLEAACLKRWSKTVGWETLLNTRSATWRQLPATDRDGIDAQRAVELMLAQPTLIKRPVLETADTLLVGFKAAQYAQLFG